MEVCSNTGLPQDARKLSNKQPKLISKGTGKIRTNKTPNQQKEGNNKDKSRNNLESRKQQRMQ